MNLRHRDRRTSMRPSDPIDTSKYEVAELRDDRTPKAFVERHHYSGSYPAARERFGLFRGSELAGVAVFSHPPSEDVLARLPCERMAGIELGRFVLLDDVPGNGETWFLARCFDGLRKKGIECLLSHSDPVPRRSRTGEVVMPGHVGIIYQASNAVYAGRSRSHKICLLPDGTIFSERSMSKIRSAERGWERDVRVLVDAGATAPRGLVSGGAGPCRKTGRAADSRWLARRDWMWRAIAEVCTRVEHAGNHRYLWALDKHVRKAVEAMRVPANDNGVETRYPKRVDEIRSAA
jgi:hypothetical protein